LTKLQALHETELKASVLIFYKVFAADMFNLPVRIVDTAGFEEIQNLEEINSRKMNRKLLEDMLK